jgi:formylglycine-generating enzyme required for sulfatase activity
MVAAALGAATLLLGACASVPAAKPITSFGDIAGWWVATSAGHEGRDLKIANDGTMIVTLIGVPNPLRLALQLRDGKAVSTTPQEQLVATLQEREGRRLLRFVSTESGGRIMTLDFIPQAESTDLRHPATVKVDTEIVLVPAGEFTMGSDADAHRVHLSAFYIDKYETSFVFYQLFLNDTGRRPPLLSGSMTWADFGNPKQPVVGVTWHDADAFCKWAGKRLPTEAQWEKAARGTDGRRYPWGDQWDGHRLNSQGEIGKTVAVGSYPSGASPFNVHDMAGNVSEWVADWFDAYQPGAATDPRGPAIGEYKVRRGGSWFDSAADVSTTVRMVAQPGGRDPRIGFRCAKAAP